MVNIDDGNFIDRVVTLDVLDPKINNTVVHLSDRNSMNNSNVIQGSIYKVSHSIAKAESRSNYNNTGTISPIHFAMIWMCQSVILVNCILQYK